jgi:homopolymeric O-antigen transport system permease protein
LVARLRELLAYRELVANLTVRDLKLKYKRSSLGVAWSLLNPIFLMAIYTAVFSVLLRLQVRDYWALVLAGLLAWVFFANAIGSATTSFVQGANLISKVYFPIEALPIASVIAQFVNFLISMVLLVAVLLGLHVVTGSPPIGASLVLLPVILVAQLVFVTGLAMFVATVTVYMRDLEHLVTIGLTALFYLSPVLYPLDATGLGPRAQQLIQVVKFNPLAWYLSSFQSVLFYGRWPDPVLFTLMLVAAPIALVGGYLVFARFRRRLPEEV